ncbi:ABC transporter ATP-binding protein [Robertmurraya korlensis]|uniref:ABC transporter ATP-binding protein n=1 Tax=Robertmurraya korlensis TaxID=519977 RepID=UPI00203CAAFD|nr:ABC transporter ATP-binding protein [Robertmurraya korlensis]MCM3603202.1 ABC transporter ATP-binding protein [Robertmurraya korlensis]
MNKNQWVIQTNNLGKQYNSENWAIRGINTTLKKGEFVALIGSNGAGKSTFIHSICGLLEPTVGEVYYNSEQIDNKNPFYNIGWSSQRQVIDWYLSVYDNVFLGARLAGYSKAAAHEKTLESLELVGLKEYTYRQPDALSGGQQQRVQIARSLVHNPFVIILDEPTTGLDAESSEKLLNYLHLRSREGALVVVSSHDLALLETYCDRVLLLSDGTILASENKEEFLTRFAGEEIICIDYEGEINKILLDTIKANCISVIANYPLEIKVRRGFSIGDIISILEGHVRVIDVKRNLPGLREAYLSFTKKKGVV